MAQSNRRRWRNSLLEPRVQLRYGVYCFLFAAGTAVLVQFLSYWSMRREVLRILQEAGGDAALLQGIIDLSMRSAFLGGLWLLPLVAAVGLFGAAHFIHRFIGPQVPVRRHIAKLRDGEYGAECRIRARDELHDLVGDLNDLSVTLRERHATEDRPEPLRTRRDAGFSLLEVLVIMATISVITALGVGQFLRAYDRARQRSSMADMRTVAAANGTYHVDYGDYSPDLVALTPYYAQPVPSVDRWGFAWTYASDGTTYAMRSRGSDGLDGPAPPSPWSGDPYECDLVLESGAFTQAPDI